MRACHPPKTATLGESLGASIVFCGLRLDLCGWHHLFHNRIDGPLTIPAYMLRVADAVYGRACSTRALPLALLRGKLAGFLPSRDPAQVMLKVVNVEEKGHDATQA